MGFESLRTMATGFLTHTCTIREASTVAYDEELGYDVPTPGTLVYEGACLLRPNGGERGADVGDSPVTIGGYVLALPWDTLDIEVDQVVTIDESNDPHLLDRTYRVVHVGGGSHNPYRRVGVDEVEPRSEP